jgi:hypothetical protein
MDTSKLRGFQSAKRWAETRDGISIEAIPHPEGGGIIPDDVSLDALLTEDLTWEELMSRMNATGLKISKMAALDADKLIDRVAEAMRLRRRELIAQPLERIWRELAKTAIGEMGK